MKRFCLSCGEPLDYCLARQRKYCSDTCSNREQRRKLFGKPRTLVSHFQLFKNIVAASQSAEEFTTLYQQYFEEDSK